MMRDMDFVDEYYADKDLSLLKKLTLVIPTYNRNYYLSRCLWYHAHFPFGEIIVADSSPEEKKMVNRETVQKIREKFGANVRYLEYEPETEKYGGDIYRKWGDAVQHVETEYSAICTDKAFKLPVSQIWAIDYLEKNHDYISADFGKWLYFVQKEKQSQFTNRCNKMTEDMESAYLRYIHALTLGPNGSLLLSTIRSNTQKQIYKNISIENINDIRYGEIYLAYCGHFFGKYKYSEIGINSVRDISKICLKHKALPTSESSNTRYPRIPDYDYIGKQQGIILRKKYEQTIRDLIMNNTNKSQNECDKFLLEDHRYLISTSNYVGFPKIKVIMKYYYEIPIISYIYQIILKNILEKIKNIRTRTQTNEGSLEPNAELVIVQKIIRETDYRYEFDLPIRI